MLDRLAALALGTLVSEDLTCIAAGLLVSRGAMALLPAIVACALGIYAGDLGLWIAGRVLGSRAVAWPQIAAIVTSNGAAAFASWFDRHARTAIVGSRFAPGTRLPLYVAAGASGTSFARFAIWSAVAVAMWTPLLVAGAAASGEQLALRLSAWLAVGRAVTIAAALVTVIVWQLVVRAVSLRGRQRLWASVSRIWRWEFWPMWLFYPPVALWTLWLAVRHGGFRSISAANPGIPDGGIVGESKFDILRRLPAEWTIPSAVLEPGAPRQRRSSLRDAMDARGWAYPLILKPDIGQRGTGVRLVKDENEAVHYLSLMTGRAVVQPYHAGPFEAGVFYYRMPGSCRGRILTVTDKHFPAVIGDGRSNLEDLIWAHPRYRMQARTFLARFGPRRRTVPATGERVTLGIAGNHAQGAMFTDGRTLITPALEARIDAIARAYDGFFIGRFDIRYRDRQAFLAGLDLSIVELNGATAECTNIYDPAGSLLSAYRQLFQQWRLVFAIGAANRRIGRPASSIQRLLQLLRGHMTTPTPFPVSD